MVVLGTTLLRALRTLRPPTPAGAPVRRPVQPVLSPVWKWTCPVRTLQVSSAVYAGHNKWSKVKNIKGPKDAARGSQFSKFGLLIRNAIKEGGTDLELNVKLAHILEQCRNMNMPKASIEAAMKAKAKPLTQHMFEARGPGGCKLLIEVLTDNNARTTQDIRRILNKNRGMLPDKTRHKFNQRGVVVVSGENVTTEKALELAIKAGAEDVQDTEDEEEKPQLKFICAVADLRKVRGSLESLGTQVISAELEYFHQIPVYLDDNQMKEAAILIEALNDCPEVMRVWDNIQAAS